jgi:uncharacterized protein
MKEEIGKTIFEDRAPLSIYKDPSKETIKPHKRAYIRRENGKIVDVTSLSKPVAALFEDQEILRYYFLNDMNREKVLGIKGEGHAASG